MRWLATVSAEQVDEVRSALRSGHGMVIEPALHNVVLHQLEDLVPIIEEGVGAPKSYARAFGELCGHVLNFGDNRFEKLRESLTTELSGDAFLSMRHKPRHFRPVRHMVTSVIVINEVRAVRAGRKKEPDLHDLDLSPFETELVKLSGLKVATAVDAILVELSKARVAGTREYTLIQVLHTYPPGKYFPSVLDKLEQIVGTEGYGTTLLLESLKLRFHRLDKAGKARVLSIIESIRRTGVTPSFEFGLSALESELQ